MSRILHLNQLSKDYGRLRALKEVSFSLESGQVLGLLGPNGSGKTTCLGILLGVLQPTRGQFTWFEQNPTAQLRRRIGALLEQPNFYPWMSAADNLRVLAQVREGQNNIDQALKEVGLYERRNDPFRTFSLGMKQRLAIAGALLGDPEVLVLDEPTNGVDAKGIAEIREVILRQARNGRTVLLASHILDEVEKTCSHVVVLRDGEVLQSGSIREVLHGEGAFEVGAEDSAALKSALHDLKGIKNIEGGEEGRWRVFVEADLNASTLNRSLFEKGVVLTHLSERRQSLESHFLKLLDGKNG